MINISHVQQ